MKIVFQSGVWREKYERATVFNLQSQDHDTLISAAKAALQKVYTRAMVPHINRIAGFRSSVRLISRFQNRSSTTVA